MSKKLKKKIEEVCGLKDLSWEARQARAEQILASPEWKQSLCNELIGLSFRILEQTLSGVASERQKKEECYDEEPKNDKRYTRSIADTKAIARRRPTNRTLEEILAQVRAPRVVQELSDEERAYLRSFRPHQRSGDEIPSNPNDVDDSPGESMV